MPKTKLSQHPKRRRREPENHEKGRLENDAENACDPTSRPSARPPVRPDRPRHAYTYLKANQEPSIRNPESISSALFLRTLSLPLGPSLPPTTGERGRRSPSGSSLPLPPPDSTKSPVRAPPNRSPRNSIPKPPLPISRFRFALAPAPPPDWVCRSSGCVARGVDLSS